MIPGAIAGYKAWTEIQDTDSHKRLGSLYTTDA